MFDISGASLVANLLFSSVGFVAFIYGKRTNLWKMMFAGLALMIFPYFVSDASLLFGFGGAGTAALYFLRH